MASIPQAVPQDPIRRYSSTAVALHWITVVLVLIQVVLGFACNQPFSQWDKIFPNPAMTVAAIDRLVHHATILEFNAESYRRRTAAKKAELAA